MPETKFTTSFIPKKPVAAKPQGTGYKRKKTGIWGTLTFVIFILTIVAAGGAFLYKKNLENKITEQVDNLQKTVDAFPESFINESVRLSDRITAAESLLEKHVSPSQIFTLLEEETLRNISFNDLDYFYDEDGRLRITSSGLGRGFESIVLQSDRYGKTNYMRDVIFSGLQPNQEGNITFTFESAIEDEFVKYRNTFTETTLDDVSDNENEEGDSFDPIENTLEDLNDNQ
jgi:hypothetical protein